MTQLIKLSNTVGIAHLTASIAFPEKVSSLGFIRKDTVLELSDEAVAALDPEYVQTPSEQERQKFMSDEQTEATVETPAVEAAPVVTPDATPVVPAEVPTEPTPSTVETPAV